MIKHTYPIVPDIGLKVHRTFATSFNYFGHEWKFKVRSQSEANIARDCLTYYKPMWDCKKFTDPLNREDVVVDIGAHVGFFAIPASSQVKKVFAYEPSPANHQLLCRNVTLNDAVGVAPMQQAVWYFDGTSVLNLGVQGTTGHSVTNRKRGGVSVEVSCISTRTLVHRHNPSVLKMDCEGAEWDILEDPDMLEDVRILVAELHKVKQHDLPFLLKTLKQAGMKTVVHTNAWFSKLIAYRK